jgi:hypothetical protein
MVRITVVVPGASRALGKRNPEGNHFTIASQCRWTRFWSGCKLLIPLNGEMSEWLKEHAWKLLCRISMACCQLRLTIESASV